MKNQRFRIQLRSFPQNHHYVTVGRAIAFIRENLISQPSLNEIANHVGVSSQHLIEIFHTWAGITPKQLIKVLTLDNAKKLLLENYSNLETSYEVGLSGTGRLHDLFVTIDSMSPGEFKMQGRGLQMHWGLHMTPFGNCLLIATQRGLTHLYFPDDESIEELIGHLSQKWKHAQFSENPIQTALYVDQIFYGKSASKPLPLLLKGTPFQVKIWQALLEIPNGNTTAYSKLAAAIGKPAAHRAAATAVGDNPISYLIPCHRVLRKTLALGGYRWGLDRKTAMLATEL